MYFFDKQVFVYQDSELKHSPCKQKKPEKGFQLYSDFINCLFFV